ncbi:hypothetical protein Taro_014816, partial [Colocasia esculenta]|nr:hypothetical protein [Colocasia esculenta]
RDGAGRRDSVAASRAVATLSRPIKGEMRARVSWTLVLAAFLALPPFQRERVDEMGFGQVFRIERMRVDPALTQALRSRWDTEASAFAFPWGHMIPSLEDVSRITGLRVYGQAVSGYTYPCYHDLAERLLDLPVERRSSLVPRVAESLGLFEAGKNAGETEDEYLERLARVSRRELASEPGTQADLDLRRFLVLFLGRLLFATRGDAVHCRFLPLLADLGEVGGYAWGAAFLAHQFDGLSASERQTSTSGFYPFLQVWAYLHLPALRRGELTRPGLVPIARRWDSRRDTRHLADQLEHLQEALDSYPYLDVVWQPYLGEGDEGQPWRLWGSVQRFIGRESDRCGRAAKILRWGWRRKRATRAQGASISIGGVTGIAVEIGSWKGVTGIAVEIRSWKGVTGIAVEIGSAREATGIAVGMRSTRG